MEYIDIALELLRDSHWHTLLSLEKEISLPEEKLNSILLFLKEYGFIERDNEKMRITSLGLRFLELSS